MGGSRYPLVALVFVACGGDPQSDLFESQSGGASSSVSSSGEASTAGGRSGAANSGGASSGKSASGFTLKTATSSGGGSVGASSVGIGGSSGGSGGSATGSGGSGSAGESGGTAATGGAGGTTTGGGGSPGTSTGGVSGGAGADHGSGGSGGSSDCECTEGACCDGCHFRPADYPCLVGNETWAELRPEVPFEPYAATCTGNRLDLEFRNVYCSGVSLECTRISDVLGERGGVCDGSNPADGYFFGDTCVTTDGRGECI